VRTSVVVLRSLPGDGAPCAPCPSAPHRHVPAVGRLDPGPAGGRRGPARLRPGLATGPGPFLVRAASWSGPLGS